MNHDFFSLPISKEILLIPMMMIILYSVMPSTPAAPQDKTKKKGNVSMDVNELSAALKIAREERISLMAQIEETRNFLAKTKVTKREENKKSKTMEARLYELKEKLKKMEQMIDKLKGELMNFQQQSQSLSELNKAIKEAKIKKVSLMAEVEEIRHSLEKERTRTRETKKERDKKSKIMEAKLYELKEELEKKELMINQLKRELENTSSPVLDINRGIPLAKATPKNPLFLEVVKDHIVLVNESNYKNSVYYSNGWPVLVKTRESKGEQANKIQDSNSEFRKTLRELDSEKDYLVFIMRNGSSFASFRKARDIAARANFQVGWEPIPGKDNGKLIFGGQGGRKPPVVE